MVPAETELVCSIARTPHNIEIEVWSSLYSNEKSMIDGENDTRIACDKSIEP